MAYVESAFTYNPVSSDLPTTASRKIHETFVFLEQFCLSENEAKFGETFVQIIPKRKVEISRRKTGIKFSRSRVFS